MHKTMILPVCLGVLLVGIVMIPGVFAETYTVIIVEPGGNCMNEGYQIWQEPSNVCFKPGILRIQVGDTVTWVNESSEGRKVVSENPDHNFESLWITGYNDRANFEEKGLEWNPSDRTTSFSYTFNQNDIGLYYYGYPTEREIRISDYKFSGAILVGCPSDSADLLRIIGGEWINFATLEGYQGNKDYDLGYIGNECQKKTDSEVEADNVAESAYTMSTYVHPDQKYSIQHPSTWSVVVIDDLALGFEESLGQVIFTDSEDWTIEVEVNNLGSLPFIDTQSEQERFVGTILGERLYCTTSSIIDIGYVCRDVEPTGEHGFVTLSSGEVVHSVSYTAVREYPEEHIVEIASTAFDFLCCTNHIYQIIFHIDTTNPASIPNETIFQIKQDMLESFTFLPVASSEPDPKSTQQASSGCGQGTVLVDGVCQLAPQESNDGCGEGTVMVNGVCQLAKTSSPFNILSVSTIEPLYIVIGAVAVGGGIVGVVFVVRRGSSGAKTPKPARQDLDDYEEQYLRKQGQRPSRKPAEIRQTSAFCDSCGAKLKPAAKFCGKCGSPRS